MKRRMTEWGGKWPRMLRFDKTSNFPRIRKVPLRSGVNETLGPAYTYFELFCSWVMQGPSCIGAIPQEHVYVNNLLIKHTRTYIICLYIYIYICIDVREVNVSLNPSTTLGQKLPFVRMWFLIPTPPYVVDGKERGSIRNQRYALRSDEEVREYLRLAGYAVSRIGGRSLGAKRPLCFFCLPPSLGP